MRHLIVIALALFALGSVTCLAEAPAGKAPSRPQWEYQTQSGETLAELGKKDIAAGLNKVGDDGWELVAVTTTQDARPGGTPRSAYYFKRAKGQAAETTRPVSATPEAAPERLQIVRLRFATAPELAKTLQAVFGNRPARVIVPDARTNTLILRGSEMQIEEVKLLVRELDVEGEHKKATP
jgi:type II secretory pathway component GspD/PulD (secretin)